MRRVGRSVAIGLGVLLAAAPLTILGTLLLSPFWKWLEATRGIESYGHSGPAEWCYGATYAGFVVLVSAILFLGRRKRPGGGGA